MGTSIHQLRSLMVRTSFATETCMGRSEETLPVNTIVEPGPHCNTPSISLGSVGAGETVISPNSNRCTEGTSASGSAGECLTITDGPSPWKWTAREVNGIEERETCGREDKRIWNGASTPTSTSGSQNTIDVFTACAHQPASQSSVKTEENAQIGFDSERSTTSGSSVAEGTVLCRTASKSSWSASGSSADAEAP